MSIAKQFIPALIVYPSCYDKFICPSSLPCFLFNSAEQITTVGIPNAAYPCKFPFNIKIFQHFKKHFIIIRRIYKSGDGQMQWLEAQLLDCRGPFIILSCGTMWSDYVSAGKDSWGRWDPKGRERIFKLIEKNRIGGVLLISGDRHGARGFTIPRPSGFKFYEFEAASLGGRRGPPVTKPEWTEQFYGIAGEYAFGEFTIDATTADPEVAFRLIRVSDGGTIHEMKLKRSQLTPRGD